jgi:TusA-related sulfurtransferase
LKTVQENQPVEPVPSPLPPSLDLRGTPCPVNFIRARLALEKLPAGSWLQIDLDAGDPERMVSQGLRGEGHDVQLVPRVASAEGAGVRLLVRRIGS